MLGSGFCILIGKPTKQNKLHHVWKLFMYFPQTHFTYLNNVVS